MDTKICTGCSRDLPLSAFHKNGDRLQARCRDCRSIKVTSEPATYRPDGADSFFADIARKARGNADAIPARKRLERHELETAEQRDVTAQGGASGLIPPAYLAAEWAGIARKKRPLADRVNSFPLPPYGESFTVPMQTTGVTVGVGTTENAAVSEQDIASNATIKPPLVTISGQQDLSIQSLERSGPGLDTVIYNDLRKAEDAALEDALLNGNGTGTHLGLRSVSSIQSVTWTQATPDPASGLTAIAKAVGLVSSARFVNRVLVLLHPRRAAWFAQASGTASLSDQPAFSEFGFEVEFVVDNSMPTNLGAGTNQDPIVVCAPDDLYLAESESFIRAADVLSGNLTVRLQMYSYSTFISHRYPSGIAVVSGTGSADPNGYGS